MIRLFGRPARLCDGLTRRDFLRIGSLGALGLGLPAVLRAESEGRLRRTPARACILLYLQGGQSQLETFDMKPDAPDSIRGVFNSIAGRVPGTSFCEHLPRLAAIGDKFALIRSMNHRLTTHNPAGCYALSGIEPTEDRFDLKRGPDDHPSPGSVLAKLRPGPKGLPAYTQLSGPILGDIGIPMPGHSAGFLGAAYDPLHVTLDPNEPHFGVEELSLPAGVSGDRQEGRRRLLEGLEGDVARLGDRPEWDRLDEFQRRALGLVTSAGARRAFAIDEERAAIRDRYGRHTPGQSLLLARRLVEAGVRFVTVSWGGALNVPEDYWDTHTGSIPKQRDKLLPRFDQCLSALLEDLDSRGLLDSTLVLSMGEFGRTPRMGQATGDNGTDGTGRDHWPHCYSVLLAGGGITGGAVVGRSDRYAAYPVDRPTSPSDLIATAYRALGLDPAAEINDRTGRPMPISRGSTIKELLAG